jgi:hypothetical protein
MGTVSCDRILADAREVRVWLLFTFILFVAEPLILHRRFDQWAATQPNRALARLQRAYWVLLALGVITILGAVAGSQGLSLP